MLSQEPTPPPVETKEYKYYKGLFAQDIPNKSSIVSISSQRLTIYLETVLKHTSLGKMDFKIAVVRRKELRRDISTGYKAGQKQKHSRNSMLPPLYRSMVDPLTS